MSVSTREGYATMRRLAQQLALEVGVPIERAAELVQALFRIMREDIEAGPRFVLAGTLILERRPEGSRKSHSVRLVLSRRKMAARRIARFRDAKRNI